MRKYQVKLKLVDGKEQYGLVDEEFNEVLPYQFNEIIEKN